MALLVASAMPFYKISGCKVTATNESQARMILKAAPSQWGRRLIIIPKDGSAPRIIELEEGPGFDIVTQDRDEFTFVGGLIGGAGERLLQAAADSFQHTSSQGKKLASLTRKAKQQRRHDTAEQYIDHFELSIPDSMRALYDEVMDAMQCTTQAYLFDMINGFEGVTFKPENWQPLLSWFKEKVLAVEQELPIEQRRTDFVLRKTFVTAGIRMVQGDARNANSMRLVQKAEPDFDWGKYADEKNKS